VAALGRAVTRVAAGTTSWQLARTLAGRPPARSLPRHQLSRPAAEAKFGLELGPLAAAAANSIPIHLMIIPAIRSRAACCARRFVCPPPASRSGDTRARRRPVLGLRAVGLAAGASAQTALCLTNPEAAGQRWGAKVNH